MGKDSPHVINEEMASRVREQFNKLSGRTTVGEVRLAIRSRVPPPGMAEFAQFAKASGFSGMERRELVRSLYAVSSNLVKNGELSAEEIPNPERVSLEEITRAVRESDRRIMIMSPTTLGFLFAVFGESRELKQAA